MKDFNVVTPFTGWEEEPTVQAPEVKTVDVHPPQMEDAPALVVVLAASLMIALLAAAPLYIIGQMPMWLSVIIGIVVVGLLVFSYLGMRYQWFHMVSLQKTERLRIKAWWSVADKALTVRQELIQLQREQLAARQPQQVEQAPAPVIQQPTIRITEKGRERESPKYSATYMEVQEWAAQLYDANGTLNPRRVLAAHTKSPLQVNYRKPSPEAFAIMERWGWVEDDGNVYRWYGPPTLSEMQTKFT